MTWSGEFINHLFYSLDPATHSSSFQTFVGVHVDCFPHMSSPILDEHLVCVPSCFKLQHLVSVSH